MTDPQAWVAPTYERLADFLAAATAEAWDAPSLCEKWLVRHVIAHLTMPARLTPEQLGAEMAAAGSASTWSAAGSRPPTPSGAEERAGRFAPTAAHWSLFWPAAPCPTAASSSGVDRRAGIR